MEFRSFGAPPITIRSNSYFRFTLRFRNGNGNDGASSSQPPFNDLFAPGPTPTPSLGTPIRLRQGRVVGDDGGRRTPGSCYRPPRLLPFPCWTGEKLRRRRRVLEPPVPDRCPSRGTGSDGPGTVRRLHAPHDRPPTTGTATANVVPLVLVGGGRIWRILVNRSGWGGVAAGRRMRSTSMSWGRDR